MARPLRIDYPDTFYHVLSRGNERKEIFRDEKDHLRFLDTLGRMVERFKLEVHAYVLMKNIFIYLSIHKRPISPVPSSGWVSVIRSGSTEKPQARSLLRSRDIRAVALDILRGLGEQDPELILKVRKYRCQNRDVAIYILYQLGVYLNREIGKMFGVGYTAVIGAVKRGLKYIRSDGQLARVVNKIIADI